MGISRDELRRRFTPIAADLDTLERKDRVSAAALAFAETLRTEVPGSRELSLALDGLDEIVGRAHQGIDREALRNVAATPPRGLAFPAACVCGRPADDHAGHALGHAHRSARPVPAMLRPATALEDRAVPPSAA
jgi:hypothetical protein